MAGSLGLPTQLLLTASIKGMTAQRALIRKLWALGRKLRVEIVTLRLFPHLQPCEVTQVKDPCMSSSLRFLPCHQQPKMPFTPF